MGKKGANKQVVNKNLLAGLGAFVLTLVICLPVRGQGGAEEGEAEGKPAVLSFRVATINSQRLDKEYKVLATHVALILEKREVIEAEAKAMMNDVKPAIERMKEIRAKLAEPITDEQKRALAVEHEQLFQTFQKRNVEAGRARKEKMDALAAKSREKRNALLKKVRGAIAKVTAEKQIVFVMEHSQLENRGEVVWYATPELDITDEVLDLLNAEPAE